MINIQGFIILKCVLLSGMCLFILELLLHIVINPYRGSITSWKRQDISQNQTLSREQALEDLEYLLDIILGMALALVGLLIPESNFNMRKDENGYTRLSKRNRCGN